MGRDVESFGAKVRASFDRHVRRRDNEREAERLQGRELTPDEVTLDVLHARDMAGRAFYPFELLDRASRERRRELGMIA